MTESVLQQHIVKLLRSYARPDVCWWHCPNSTPTGWRAAVEAKALGVRAGASDLMFLIDGKFHVLELKTESGRLSKEQREFQIDIERAGGFFYQARGLDRAIQVLTALNVFLPSVSVSAATDASGVRKAGLRSKGSQPAERHNSSPVKPWRAAAPVSPNT